MRCITSSRFNMIATIIRQDIYGTPRTSTEYANKQSALTFEVDRVWAEDSDTVTAGVQHEDFRCIARGIVDGGIRVVGTTERITPAGLIQSEDYVRVQFPADVALSKRDRVYNIRSAKSGVTLWKEEEHDGAPTVFEVLGVTPIFDPFGQMVEQQALLQRAEVQSVG